MLEHTWDSNTKTMEQTTVLEQFEQRQNAHGTTRMNLQRMGNFTTSSIEKKKHTDAWIWEYVYEVEPLALGSRAFGHVALTPIRKPCSIKGVEPPAFKQCCQQGNKSFYQKFPLCPVTIFAGSNFEMGRGAHAHFTFCLKQKTNGNISPVRHQQF